MPGTYLNSSSSSLQLDWSDDHGQITVTPRDEDRFTIKMRRAIEVLQRAAKEDLFQKQFKVLLGILGQWALNRPDVKGSYITLRDGRLAFVVVRTESTYNEQFEDDLSELDISIANDVDLDLIELDAIGLPNVSAEALKSFLHPEFNLAYSNRNGESKRPPSPSK